MGTKKEKTGEKYKYKYLVSSTLAERILKPKIVTRIDPEEILQNMVKLSKCIWGSQQPHECNGRNGNQKKIGTERENKNIVALQIHT